MAGMTCSAAPGAVALSATVAKTVLQLAAPANQRLILRNFGLSFDGVSSGAGRVVIRLLKQTTAGTMSASTEVRHGPGSETPQATAQHNATAEPTAGDPLQYWTCDPMSNLKISFGYGELILAGGERIGIECTAPATVNCYPTIEWEE